MKKRKRHIFVGLLILAATAAKAQFTYTTNADGTTITITGYTGSGGAVVIPSAINDLPVVNIRDYASFGYALTSVSIPDSVTNIAEGVFYFCEDMTNIMVAAQNPDYSSLNGVLFDKNQTMLIQYPPGLGGAYTIPDGVTSIGDAFAGCYNLTNVTIPDSVTNIGEGAFSYTGLTSVSIGDGVTNIGGGAFEYCGLTSVAIPASVINIGEEVFYSCEYMTNIMVAAQNPDYSSLNGVLFDKNQTMLIQYPPGLGGAYTIPDGVTSIGDEAFAECYSLANVTIPDSVTNIGGGAFLDCGSLAAVFFKGNAPAVGPVAFFEFAVDTYIPLTLTVYYLHGTIGWNQFSTNSSLATVCWNPVIQTGDGSFGVQNNQFGFNITIPDPDDYGVSVLVEACANLANPVWSPVQTVTVFNGSAYFSETLQTNVPGRFYRLGFP